jgi:hypothetical protein
MRVGSGDAFCERVLQAVEQFKPEHLARCADSLVLGLPEVSELGGWTELNPREHGELYKKLLQYDAVGAKAYFGQQPDAGARREKSDEELQRAFDVFVSSGGRMRVKRVQLFTRAAAHPAKNYPHPQTIVEYR